MKRRQWLGVIAALTLIALALSGCGGGSGSGGTIPPPVGDTGTIAGQVMRADDPTIAVANATVTVVLPAGSAQTAAAVTTTTDSQGSFTLTGVPVGTQTLSVTTPGNPNLRSQNITSLIITKNATTRVMVTLLRLDQSDPTILYLSPVQATVDVNGEVQFSAQVVSGSGTVDAEPGYVVTGGIGTITAAGKFSATAVGQGQVRAVCGGAEATASLVVTASRPPEVTTYIVSPLEFTASGGNLSITLAANDGDGIDLVLAEIYAPNADPIYVTLPRVAGTDRDGTYRGSWTVPGNTNIPDAQGVQAPMTYSVRVVVQDFSSAAQTTGFTDFVVRGLQQPPNPF